MYELQVGTRVTVIDKIALLYGLKSGNGTIIEIDNELSFPYIVKFDEDFENLYCDKSELHYINPYAKKYR